MNGGTAAEGGRSSSLAQSLVLTCVACKIQKLLKKTADFTIPPSPMYPHPSTCHPALRAAEAKAISWRFVTPPGQPSTHTARRLMEEYGSRDFERNRSVPRCSATSYQLQSSNHREFVQSVTDYLQESFTEKLSGRVKAPRIPK